MKKTIIHLLAIAFIISSWGCKSSYYKTFEGQGDIYDQERPIAIIETDTLTVQNFNRALNNNGWHRMDEFDTMQFKRDVLRDEVVFRAARIKAQDYPLEYDNDLILRQTDHSNAILRQMLFKNNVEPRVEITDQDIEDSYKSNLERFVIPERARIAQIIFSNSRAYLRHKYGLEKNVTDQILDSISTSRLNLVLNELDAGRTFEELARLYSDDTLTGFRDGEWGFINRGETEEAFDSTVFSLPVGEISQPLQTRYGYHLIKVLERQDKDYQPLDEDISAMLKGELFGQRVRHEAARYFDSLVAVSELTFNEEFIAREDTIQNLTDWIALINKIDTIPATEYFIILKKEIAKNPGLRVDSRIRREIVNSISYSYLLISEAKKNGFDQSEEYKQAIDEFIFQEKLNRLLLEKNAAPYEPSDSTLEAYYQKHQSEFYEDTSISIQQLIVESEEDVKAVLAELDSSTNFYQTALKYFPGEDEEIKKLAINLGWITRDDISPEFFSQIYNYDVGQISEPIKTEWGYHVVKVLGKKGIKSLESVRVAIRKTLVDSVKTEARLEWEERMLSGLKIKIDEKLLSEFMFQVDWMPKPDFSKMFPKY